MGRDPAPSVVATVDDALDPLSDNASDRAVDAALADPSFEEEWQRELAAMWTRLDDDLAAAGADPLQWLCPDDLLDAVVDAALPPTPSVQALDGPPRPGPGRPEPSTPVTDEPGPGLDGPPGPRTAALVDAARRSSVARADADTLVAAATAARRLEAWAVHQQLESIADLLRVWSVEDVLVPRASRTAHDVDPSMLVRESVVTEVALAFGISEQAAADRVTAAEALVVDERLPQTARLLREGTIGWDKVWTVVSRTRFLSAAAAAPPGEGSDDGATVDLAQVVDARIAPLARDLTIPALRRALDTEVVRLDSEAVAWQRARSRRDRRVGVTVGYDGLGSAQLWAVGPAEAIVAAHEGLDAAARHLRSAGDGRTLDQLRHDLLVTACTTGHLPGRPTDTGPAEAGIAVPARIDAASVTAGETAGETATETAAQAAPETTAQAAAQAAPEAAAGHADSDAWFGAHFPDVQPTITVTVSLETLLGLRDDPAFLGDHGPVPAELARDLAANGIWRCLAVDDTHGTVLGVGTGTFTPAYTPSARLKRFLADAVPRCSMRGCRARAHRCDLDHRIPHAEGGATCDCNVVPLCRRHHRLKTAGLLSAAPRTGPADPLGAVTWTTRTGRRYAGPSHAPLPPVRPRHERSATGCRGSGPPDGAGPPNPGEPAPF